MKKVDIDTIQIVKGYLKKDHSFNIDSSDDEILKQANRYCLGPIVAYTLSKENRKNKYLNIIYKAVTRYEKQEDIRKLMKKKI